MCVAAFGVVNIIAKAKDIFVKFIDILKSRLHGDPFGFA